MSEIDKRFIDLYKEMGKAHGMGDLLATIFARLYIEPGDVAMDDLARETGYSLASISNCIRMFGSIVPIKKTRKPGSKKIFLYMEKNLIKMTKDILFRKEEYGMKIAKENLPSIINEFKNKAKSNKDKQKLKILEDYYKQVLKCEVVIREVIAKFDKI